MPARVSAKSICATAASWRSPAKTRSPSLKRIGDDNRKHEFYLTDAVEIARGMKLRAVAVEAEEDDVRGINTKAQLAEAEAVAQERLRKAALDAGVTLVAPETVFLCCRHQIRPGRRGRALCGVRREA